MIMLPSKSILILLLALLSLVEHVRGLNHRRSHYQGNSGNGTNRARSGRQRADDEHESRFSRRFYQRSALDLFNINRLIPTNLQDLTNGFGTSRFAARERSLFDELSPSRCDLRQTTTSFFFFSKPDAGSNYETKVNSFDRLEGINFDPKRRTYIVIHGWFGCSLKLEDYQIVYKDKVTSKKNGANYFLVDWSHHAHNIAYARSVERMAEVADDIFHLLKNLESAFPSFKRTNIHIVGFSLGAHVAGQLGRLLGGQANQITGLDPAGVQIINMHPKFKLTVDDAKYVLVLHTNIKFYGTRMNMGHHDVFVNGGLIQPSCKQMSSFESNICSHRAGPLYFANESGKCASIAYKCFNWRKFSAGQCGFCHENSTDCISITADFSDSPLKSKRFTKLKSSKDSPWTFDTKDTRYYAVTADSNVHCVYIYQMIVKFSDNFKPASREHWTAYARLPVGKDIYLDTFTKLDFNHPSFVDESVSGPNVYTTLIIVDSSHGAFDVMPQKIKRMAINMSERDEEAEIYINFMSSLDYKTRKENSGKFSDIDFNIVQNPPVKESND